MEETLTWINTTWINTTWIQADDISVSMRSDVGINWSEITGISGQQDGIVTSHGLCEYKLVYYFVLKYNNMLMWTV